MALAYILLTKLSINYLYLDLLSHAQILILAGGFLAHALLIIYILRTVANYEFLIVLPLFLRDYRVPPGIFLEESVHYHFRTFLISRMASRPKRRRTKPTSTSPPNTESDTPQPGPSSLSPDVSAIFQSCMTQVMPTIEDTFKKCMEGYFQRPSSSTGSPTTLVQPPPAPSLLHELTGDIQQGTSDSRVQISLPAHGSGMHVSGPIPDNSLTQTTEFLLFNSLSPATI
nr:uncharacterized protein LOC111117311 [Crassostrea virginica]